MKFLHNHISYAVTYKYVCSIKVNWTVHFVWLICVPFIEFWLIVYSRGAIYNYSAFKGFLMILGGTSHQFKFEPNLMPFYSISKIHSTERNEPIYAWSTLLFIGSTKI